MSEKGEAVAEKFIAGMGLAYEAQNQPGIAGRLFALMVLEGRPYGLPEMAARLGISKASASTNARLLETAGVLERTTRRGDRTAVYQLTDNPYAHLMDGVVRRIERTKALIDATRREVPEESAAAAGRLGDLSRFYGGLLSALTVVREEMQHET